MSSRFSVLLQFEAKTVYNAIHLMYHLLERKDQEMSDIFQAYAITFGWAIVASVSMGVGIIITLKLFDLSTTNVDEWQLIKDGNIPMAIILAAIVLSLGLVVSAAIHP